MFADDAKIMKHIENEDSCRELKKIHQWSKRWKMEFNLIKCHVVRMGVSKKRPHVE